MSSKTMWYVVTGGPSSGKTTTVEILKKRGYRTTIEHARHYIDTQLVTGKTVEEVRRNQIEFQHRILHMQISDYARTEDQAAQLKIHELLTDVYASLGFPIAHIPVLPPEERVDFILENL